MTAKRETLAQINLLRRAIKILKKYGWTRGANARDKNGTLVPTYCKSAVSFCASGALFRADSPSAGYSTKVELFLDGLVQSSKWAKSERWRGALRKPFLLDFNDEKAKSKRDIIRLFERAIKKLGTKPASPKR